MGVASDHSGMKDLANVDSWRSRLIVPCSFEQYTAGHRGKDGKARQHNAKPIAFWRSFHSVNQVFERVIHQRMLNEDHAIDR